MKIYRYVSDLRIFRFQKVRFLFVGGLNTVVDFLIFNLIIWLTDFHPILANTISVFFSMILSYFLNNFFVFRSERAISLKGFALFMLSTGCVLLLTQNIAIALSLHVFSQMSFFTTDNGLASGEFLVSNIAKLIGIAISMVTNFILYKYVIFRSPEVK